MAGKKTLIIGADLRKPKLYEELQLSNEKGLSQCLLTEVRAARFRRQVVPGDVMRFEVRVAKRRPPFFWFDAKCLIDGEITAEVEISAYIK